MTSAQRLDPDSEQSRETFALFGLASFRAQCVEKQLAILLATAYNAEFLMVPPELRDQFFEIEFRKTMGQLVRSLRSRIRIADDLELRVERGLDLRNWLAHDYFWERAEDAMSSAGREKMMKELRDAAEFLGSLDGELTAIGEAWFEQAGGDLGWVTAEVARMRRGETG